MGYYVAAGTHYFNAVSKPCVLYRTTNDSVWTKIHESAAANAGWLSDKVKLS